MKKKQKVNFICTRNSRRFQIVEGFIKSFSNNINVYNSGSHPIKRHPNIISIMKELDIDISGHASDSIDSYIDIGNIIVITVYEYAKQISPVHPGQLNRLHWNISNPFKARETNSFKLNNFRKMQDKIKKHVKNFINNRE